MSEIYNKLYKYWYSLDNALKSSNRYHSAVHCPILLKFVGLTVYYGRRD